MGRWRYSRCALFVLAALLGGCGHPVDPSVVDPWEVLRGKLSQTVNVDWEGVPLETALRDLSKRYGVAVEFDHDALQSIPLSDPLVLHAQGIRLRSVLHLLLEGSEVWYVPRDDGLLITSAAAANSHLIGRVYPVADVTRQPGGFTEAELADVIREIISYESWEEAGGPGKIDPCDSVRTAPVRPGALFVEHTYEVHEQIEDLLDDLRSAANRGDRPANRVVPAAAAVLKALDVRVTVDLGRAPNEILREMSARHGFNVVVPWRTLGDGDAVDGMLKPGKHPSPTVLTDVPLRTALDLMLDPLDLGWTVRNDVLMVVTREAANTSLSVRTYPIPAEIDAP